MLKTERPVPHTTTANQRVERIAWAIMLMGFALFCLVEHLPFREVLATDAYPNLRAFAERFGKRSSAKATPYKFDFQ